MATLAIRNARLLFRNCEGRPGDYNRQGDRSFCVIIEPQLAEQLAAEGWNVKTTKSGEEAYIRVRVSYEFRPPKIYICENKQIISELTEDTIGELDHMDIINCDLEINPSHWEVNGKKGITGYLKRAYVTPDKGAFGDEYIQAKPEFGERTMHVASFQQDNDLPF